MSKINTFRVNYQELERLTIKLEDLETQFSKTKKYVEGDRNKGETYARVLEGCKLVEESRNALKCLVDQTTLFLQSVEEDFKRNDQAHANGVKG